MLAPLPVLQKYGRFKSEAAGLARRLEESSRTLNHFMLELGQLRDSIARCSPLPTRRPDGRWVLQPENRLVSKQTVARYVALTEHLGQLRAEHEAMVERWSSASTFAARLASELHQCDYEV